MIDKQHEPVQSWRELAAEFQALQPPPPRFELGLPVNDGVYACWIPTAWNADGDQWHVGDSSNARASFESLAELAAAKYGRSQLIRGGEDNWRVGGRSAVFFWLDLLKRWLQHDGLNYAAKYLSTNLGTGPDSDGNRTSTEWIRIKRVCELSAKYCEKLAAQDQATAPAREGFRDAGPITGANAHAPEPEAAVNGTVSSSVVATPVEAARKPPRPRGPAPDSGGDGKAAELAAEFERQGKSYEDNLAEFCDALDTAGIKISDAWKNDHVAECRTGSGEACKRHHLKTWADAYVEKDPVHVLKAIKRRIERGRKPNLAATVIQK